MSEVGLGDMTVDDQQQYRKTEKKYIYIYSTHIIFIFSLIFAPFVVNDLILPQAS